MRSLLQHKFTFLSALLTGALVFLVSFYFYAHVSEENNIRLQKKFTSEVKGKTSQIKDLFEKNNLILEGMRLHFTNSRDIEKSEFSRYAGAVIASNQFIDSMMWVPFIGADQKYNFEKNMPALGALQNSIFGYDLDGKAIPIDEQKTYFPIQYIEPFTGNQEFLGLDITSEGMLTNLMVNSYWHDGFVISPPLKNATSPLLKDAILLLSFVKKYGRIEGVVGFNIKFNKLIQSALLDFSPHTDVKVFYVDDADGEEILIYSKNNDLLSDRIITIQEEIELYHQKWKLVWQADSELLDPSGHRDEDFILFWGLFSSLLMSYATFQFFNKELAIQAGVEGKTKEIRFLEDSLHQASSTTGTINFAWDVDDNKVTWLGRPHEFFGDARLPENKEDLENLAVLQDRDYFFRKIEGLISGAVSELEHDVRLYNFPHNSERWYEARLLSKKMADSGKLFIFGAFIDVEKRKETERKIKNLASFPELSPMPTMEVDVNLNIIYLNPALSLKFPSLSLSRDIYDVFSREFINKINEAFEYQETLSIHQKIGESWYLFYIMPINIGSSSLCRIVACDVTYEQERLSEILQNNALNGFIIDKNPTLIIGIDTNGKTLFVNPEVSDLTNYDKYELVGQNIWTRLYPDEDFEQVNALMQHFQGSGEVASYEMVLTTKSGERRIVSWTSVNRWDGDELSQIILFGIDVTERNQFQGALVEEKERAEAASKAKSEFLASMSHEIRTPMNGIIATASLLEDTPLDEKQRNYIKMMVDSGDVLLSIINDVLDISKIEAGKMEIFTRPFDFKEVICSVYSLFEGVAKQKGLIYVLEYDDKIPQFLVGDYARIRQVINNFLSNALKFTNSGVVELRARVEKDESRIAHIRVSVTDTGDGVDADKIGQLFEKFTQVDAQDRPEIKGTGLGLAICKSLIEEMGGEIGAKSKKGMGSTFWFTLALPYADASDANNLSSINKIDDIQRMRFDAKVLLAEDVKTNRILVGEILRQFGLRVEEAHDGREAFELSKQRDFDLILMDLRMPDIDGLMSSEMIRRYEQENNLEPVKILALSAHVMEQHQHECYQAGMNDFVSKPVTKKSLFIALRKWLGDVMYLEDESDISGDHHVYEGQDVAQNSGAKKLVVIDTNVLAQIKEANGDMVKVLAQSAIDDIDERLPVLVSAIEDGDIKLSGDMAHAMKSMSADVGALEFSYLCREIEHKSKSGDLEGLDKLGARLSRHYDDVRLELLKYV